MIKRKFLLIFFVLVSFLTGTFVFANSNDANEKLLLQEIEKKLENEHREDFFLVHFKENFRDFEIANFNHAMGNFEGERIHRGSPPWLEDTPFEKTRYVRVDSSGMANQMARYIKSGLVESVEPIYKYELASWDVIDQKAYPNDWNNTRHWYFERIGLPELWYNQDCHEVGDNSCGGSDEIIVAVIDTGLAFEGYVANFDYYVNSSTRVNYTLEFGLASEQVGVNLWTNSNPGVDPNTCGDVHGIDMEIYTRNRMYQEEFEDFDCNLKQFEKEGQPNDDYGHGTFVSGIIASATNNSVGSVGLTHNVSIMTIKANVPFENGFWPDSIANSIYYAVDKGAHVINMSLGGPYSLTISNAVTYAVNNGVFVVAASGNDGIDGILYPAALSNVVAVGATNYLDQRASYSNYGSNLDFVAPVGGGTKTDDVMWHQTLNCMSTNCDPDSSDFKSFSSFSSGIGTSYASPQVAAAAALILGVDGELTPAEVKNVLIDTVEDIGDSGKDDQTGYGLLKVEGFYVPSDGLSNDASLSVFTVGGEDVLSLANIEVGNPEIDEGAKLWVEDFEGFSGIVATPTDINANRIVELNGDVVLDENLLTQVVHEDDVIVVSIIAENEITTKNYKVTVNLLEPEPEKQYKLYQAHVGKDGKVYTRSSTNGINWTAWSRETKNAPGEATRLAVTMYSLGERLYQSHVGKDGRIYTRSSTDGINWTAWSRETKNAPGEATYRPIAMSSFGERLYQSHVGTDGKIYTRSSTNGINWTAWSRETKNAPGEATYRPVSLVSVNNVLYQAHVGSEGRIYTRFSDGGNDLSWSVWRWSGNANEFTNFAVSMAYL